MQHFFFSGYTLNLLLRSKLSALLISIPDARTGLTKFLKLPFVIYFLYINCAAFVNNYIYGIFVLILFLSQTLHWSRYKKQLLFLSWIFVPFINVLVAHLIDLLLCLLRRIQLIHAHALLPSSPMNLSSTRFSRRLLKMLRILLRFLCKMFWRWPWMLPGQPKLKLNITVSHICNLTYFFSSMGTFLVANSTPTVTWYWSEKFPLI